jgi:hypothetical protein
VGEPFVDINKNGVYDGPNGHWDADTVIWAETRIVYTGYADPAMSMFFTNNGAPPLPGAPFAVQGPTAPTSAGYGVAFMDGNSNPLASIATYGISTLGSGVVTAKFVDAPSTLDTLGMDFSQRYCDVAPPAVATKCSNVCATAPCYVVTKVGGFAYGKQGSAAITGTCAKASGDTVTAAATLNGVSTSVSVSGTCTPVP